MTGTRTMEWAAGLFEGEGSIVPVYNKAKMRNDLPLASLRLVLGMTDEDVVRMFAEVTSAGFVQDLGVAKPGRKPMWRWVCNGTVAESVMEEMLPWLGERRTARYAEVLQEIDENNKQRLQGPGGFARKYDPAVVAEAISLYRGGMTAKQVSERTGISEGYVRSASYRDTLLT